MATKLPKTAEEMETHVRQLVEQAVGKQKKVAHATSACEGEQAAYDNEVQMAAQTALDITVIDGQIAALTAERAQKAIVLNGQIASAAAALVALQNCQNQ